MTTKDTSGPAFPHSKDERSAWTKQYPGLSKREYFAGLAMQAIISNPKSENCTHADVATVAFAQADAMLAEGSKQ